MKKGTQNIILISAGLAAAILLFGGKGKADDSGYGGAYPLPLQMQDPGTVQPEQTLATAMGIEQPTSIPAGVTKKEYADYSGNYFSSPGYKADMAAASRNILGTSYKDPYGSYSQNDILTAQNANALAMNAIIPGFNSGATKKEAAVWGGATSQDYSFQGGGNYSNVVGTNQEEKEKLLLVTTGSKTGVQGNKRRT